MKKKLAIIYLTILISFFISNSMKAQHLSSEKGEGTIGLGLGLPYGAIGLRFGYNVVNHTNLFAGLGYNIADVAYNFGVRQSFPSKKQSEFYVMGMYGSNAAIIITGQNEIKESYQGPSVGLGLKINSFKKEGSYWDVGLILPFTSSKYKDAVDAIKNNPSISDFTEAWPVLITVGYNFGL